MLRRVAATSNVMLCEPRSSSPNSARLLLIPPLNPLQFP
jgi:hypothetical protein